MTTGMVFQSNAGHFYVITGLITDTRGSEDLTRYEVRSFWKDSLRSKMAGRTVVGCTDGRVMTLAEIKATSEAFGVVNNCWDEKELAAEIDRALAKAYTEAGVDLDMTLEKIAKVTRGLPKRFAFAPSRGAQPANSAQVLEAELDRLEALIGAARKDLEALRRAATEIPTETT